MLCFAMPEPVRPSVSVKCVIALSKHLQNTAQYPRTQNSVPEKKTYLISSSLAPVSLSLSVTILFICLLCHMQTHTSSPFLHTLNLSHTHTQRQRLIQAKSLEEGEVVVEEGGEGGPWGLENGGGVDGERQPLGEGEGGKGGAETGCIGDSVGAQAKEEDEEEQEEEEEEEPFTPFAVPGECELTHPKKHIPPQAVASSSF